MRGGHGIELELGLRQRDVKRLLALAPALEQELHRHGRLADARGAFDEVETLRRQAAAEDVVKPGDTGRAFAGNRFWHRGALVSRGAPGVRARLSIAGDGVTTTGVVQIAT